MEALTEKTTFRDWWNQEHISLPEVPEDEFNEWGREVGKAYAFASWKAVDWATEAKERGYEYDRIAEILGRPEGSCRTLVKIGRAYPPVTRRYNLGPSFYDAAKTLPEGERGVALSQAIEQSYTRDQFRAFVGEFKRLRGIPEDPKPEQPAWNNGNGGRFGASADKAETQQTPTIEDSLTVADSSDLSDLVPEGLEVQQEPFVERPQSFRIEDTVGHWKGMYEDACGVARGYLDRLETAVAEVESLRAKLAGNLIEITDLCLERLDGEVSRRQLRSPHDLTIGRDTVAEDLILKGIKEVTRNRRGGA